MERVGAVLLAAGESIRFGSQSKLLAEIDGEPLVRRVARIVIASGANNIVAVTGRDGKAVEQALDGLAVRCIVNADWAKGMGGSVAAGIRALSARSIDGAFIVPADMALLVPEFFRRLGRAFEDTDNQAIIVPVTLEGEQRNPVLWPRRYFSELSQLSGTQGAKRLLEVASREAVQIRVDDPAVFTDIDTQDDLKTVLALLARAKTESL